MPVCTRDPKMAVKLPSPLEKFQKFIWLHLLKEVLPSLVGADEGCRGGEIYTALQEQHCPGLQAQGQVFLCTKSKCNFSLCGLHLSSIKIQRKVFWGERGCSSHPPAQCSLSSVITIPGCLSLLPPSMQAGKLYLKMHPTKNGNKPTLLKFLPPLLVYPNRSVEQFACT